MFSVIIPLYNKELSIRNTIYSVLNQTYQGFQIIVVNDGSTDNSLQVVEQIKDRRIRIVNKPNGGVSSARNRGILEAKHNWIVLLDGDDLWKINHLEEIKKMILLFPNEKVFVTSYEYSDGYKLYRKKRFTDIHIIEDYFRESIQENFICSINITIHRSCFNKVGFFNEKISYGEDLDQWARLARFYKIVKNENITSIYKTDAENKAMNERKINIERHMVYYIDFKQIKSSYEKKYYEKMIGDFCIESLVYKDLKNIKIIIGKYSLVKTVMCIFKGLIYKFKRRLLIIGLIIH